MDSDRNQSGTKQDEQNSWTEFFNGLTIFVVVVGGFTVISLSFVAYEAYQDRAELIRQIQLETPANE